MRWRPYMPLRGISALSIPSSVALRPGFDCAPGPPSSKFWILIPGLLPPGVPPFDAGGGGGGVRLDCGGRTWGGCRPDGNGYPCDDDEPGEYEDCGDVLRVLDQAACDEAGGACV